MRLKPDQATCRTPTSLEADADQVRSIGRPTLGKFGLLRKKRRRRFAPLVMLPSAAYFLQGMGRLPESHRRHFSGSLLLRPSCRIGPAGYRETDRPLA